MITMAIWTRSSSLRRPGSRPMAARCPSIGLGLSMSHLHEGDSVSVSGQGLCLGAIAPLGQVEGAAKDHGLKDERNLRVHPVVVQAQPDRGDPHRLALEDEDVLGHPLVVVVSQ